MSATVLITGPMIADEAQAILAEQGCHVIPMKPHPSATDLREAIVAHRPEALIVRFGAIDGAVIDAADRLRVIANHGVGYDSIDVAAATRRRIPVLVARGSNARSVAEHALAMILALMKNICALDGEVRAGRWRPAGFASLDLSGKRLGIVGCGAIGSQLARLVVPFRMEIKVYDPYLAENALPAGATWARRLADLLAWADVVSLHVPLTDETRGMIDRRALAQMKRSAYLVNTARGPVVDETALAETLRERRIAGAALDVFATEPAVAGHPLFGLPNLIASPHIAGVTRESFVRMGVASAKNVVSMLAGGRIDRANLVNPEALADPPR